MTAFFITENSQACSGAYQLCIKPCLLFDYSFNLNYLNSLLVVITEEFYLESVIKAVKGNKVSYYVVLFFPRLTLVNLTDLAYRLRRCGHVFSSNVYEPLSKGFTPPGKVVWQLRFF